MQALVLELVEGSTLQARIDSGSIPIGDALSIARQIAEGLEAAHDRGIIRGDLKPANIKLRPDGTVKILDFGLARMLDVAEVEREPYRTRRETRTRLSLRHAWFSGPPPT